MPQQSWNVTLDGRQHTIAADLNWYERCIITVDGVPVINFWRFGKMTYDSDHYFDIDRHTCTVRIRLQGRSRRFDLYIDDRSVSTGDRTYGADVWNHRLWAVRLDGNPHAVEIDHSLQSGKLRILVDGKVKHKEIALIANERERTIEVDGHELMVHMRGESGRWYYDLYVDGRSATTGAEPARPEPAAEAVAEAAAAVEAPSPERHLCLSQAGPVAT